MGFFTFRILVPQPMLGIALSQSLSGWDGVFHVMEEEIADVLTSDVAIPFRVGWGFSPIKAKTTLVGTSGVAIPFRVGWGFSPHRKFGRTKFLAASQSLSGWDGVFHQGVEPWSIHAPVWSQSLSGWDGVFHGCKG